MKITIAHPLAAAETGADLDATVEVDDAVGARLVRDGFARPAAKKSRSTTAVTTDADTEGA